MGLPTRGTPIGRLVSIQVGKVQLLGRPGAEEVPSGFRKTPVEGRVRVLARGLEGDEQGDTVKHGAPRKAVYAYPSEHYEFWRRTFPELPFAPGGFGENLTTEGIRESDLRSGDLLEVGTARLTVTQPRSPCFKLGLRYDRPTLVREFARAGRSGFYLAVAAPGEIGAGDLVVRLGRGPPGPDVAEMFREMVRDE